MIGQRRFSHTNEETPDGDVTTRDHIQKHADAVVRGDTDTVAADFSEELRSQLPQLASALSRLRAPRLLSVDVGDPQSVAMIRYSGDTGGVTIRTRWQDLGGAHPVIVHAELAD